MVGRGLRTPTSVTSDGAPGLVNAIEGIFPRSASRCVAGTTSWATSSAPSCPRRGQLGGPSPREGGARRADVRGRRGPGGGLLRRALRGDLPGGGGKELRGGPLEASLTHL